MAIYRQLTLSPIYLVVSEASTGRTGCSLHKRFNQGGNSIRMDPADTQRSIVVLGKLTSTIISRARDSYISTSGNMLQQATLHS